MARMVQEGKGWMPREAHEEGLRVARLLAKKIEAEGYSVRKVEELVGWGQKTLQQVLNGEQPIRISHLAAVLAALGLDLREFYRELEKSAGSARSSPLAPEDRAERRDFWGYLDPLTAEERRYFLDACRQYRTLVSEAAASGPGTSSADEHGLTKRPPAFEALLARSFALRYDDPTAMVELARFAAFLADHFDRRRYEARQLADWRCRAYTELGNAYRVAERLQECEEALKIAAECHVEGSADEILGARLLEIQASLDADRRRFPEAQKALDEVQAFHLRRGDRHLAGRTLIKKGLYATYDCDPERAILLLGEGLELIDPERDPELVNGAVLNLGWSLMECGRLTEAKEQLRQHRTYGRVKQLKVLWLEGRIEAGLGNLGSAEDTLERVRQGFEDKNLHYKASLVSLDLAAVHLRQGRADDARERAQQAIDVFSQLGIGRETLAALLVLRDALERRIVSVALLEGVITRLLHLEREPAGLGLREFNRELAKSAESARVSPPATEDHGDTAAVWGFLGALTAEERRYFLEASRKFQAVVPERPATKRPKRTRSSAESGSVPGPPAFEALLARSFALRYDDPTTMVELARFAAFLADHFDRRRYEARQVADLRCRAWTELANAYRVAERLHEAGESLKTAASHHPMGTADEFLRVRLLEIQASLDADRGHFSEALKALDEVYALHLGRGDRHLGGRTLIKKGLYSINSGNPEQGGRWLHEALTLIDRERDPALVNTVLENLAFSMIELGRPEEARGLLRSNHHRGRVSRLRGLWMEGRIDVGMGNLDEAERSLEKVRGGFEELDLRSKAASVDLDLAAVHLRQGRAEEARARALAAIEVFSQLGIGHETLAALLVLRDAFERRIASIGMLEGVIKRLSHLEREPAT